MNLMKLWNDEAGAVTSIEMLLYGTILGLGVVVGFSNLRSAVNAEYSELANAILHIDQGFSYSGDTGCCSSTAGSAATDTNDAVSFADCAVQPVACSVDADLCAAP